MTPHLAARHPISSITLGLVVVSWALGACSSDDGAGTATTDASAAEVDEAPVVQLGGPGETSRVLTPEEVAALPVPVASIADVDFVLSMLPHHEQALEMTALVEDRTTNERIRLFVERLEISQTDELALMERWLDEHGGAMDMDAEMDHHQHHGDLMPGMLTDDEMAELAAARDEDFDRLFLERMIRHHDGALVMVADLLAAEDGGSEPAVFRMAQDFDADQRIEIDRMEQLLAEIAGR